MICVDLQGSVPSNLHDKNVYAYLLSLCTTGRARAMLLGTPCRKISALRYQDDGGPGVLRDDEHANVEDQTCLHLTWTIVTLVQGDVVLWFRDLSLFVLAEDLRDPDQHRYTSQCFALWSGSEIKNSLEWNQFAAL